jgi:hypothetical protein
MFTGGRSQINDYFTNLSLFEIVSFTGDVREKLQMIFLATHPAKARETWEKRIHAQ